MRRAAVALCVVLAAAVSWAQDGGPPTYDKLLAAAHEHTRAGRHAEAEEALRQAVDAANTDEERAAAILTLGESLEARGKRREAVAALQRALALERGGDWLMRCLQRLGWLAEQSRQVEVAQQAWERVVELAGPDAPEAGAALVALARLDREAGRLDEALARLQALLQHDVHHAWHREARETVAEILLAREQYDRALEAARGIDDETRRRRLELQIADQLIDAGKPAQGARLAWEMLDEAPGYLPAMRLIYRAAIEQDALPALRERLQAEAAGDAPEAALAFLGEIARWEDDTEAALEHLRRLAELRPDDPDVLVDLGEAALDADRPEVGEAALREALTLSPDHRGALITLAEVLVQRGQTDEAINLLKRAVGYDPADVGTVQSLDNALRRYSLHHARVAVIEAARERSGDDTLMAWELAQAYIDLLRYEDATHELLVALDSDGTPARAVGMELERLVADELAGRDVLAAVRQHLAATTAPSDTERLALARVLLAAGDREGAQGLLEGAEGAGLAVADLARETELRGDDDVAASLYAMALGMAIPDPQRAEVAFNLARLQREQGEWRQALQTLEAGPSLDSHPEALLMRAQLLTDRAHRLDEAQEAWEGLLELAGAEPRYVAAARHGMADWLFASGRLDEAEQAYAQLAGETETLEPWGDLPPLPPGLVLPGGVALPMEAQEVVGPDPARAALRLAEIALRRGDLEEAEERFRFVAAQHAKSPWVNDALERLAFMRENLDGRGSAERRYFEALALRAQGNARTARDLLLEIAGTRDEPLADDALVALAELRAEQEEARGAADTWLSVAERFPDSLLAPQALLRAAEVLRDELDDTAGAMSALRHVIEDYPDSAAAHEARSALELLPPPRS